MKKGRVNREEEGRSGMGRRTCKYVLLRNLSSGESNSVVCGCTGTKTAAKSSSGGGDLYISVSFSIIILFILIAIINTAVHSI